VRHSSANMSTAARWLRVVQSLDDVMLLGMVVVAVPVVILLIGLPVMLVAWLITGIAARW
jgi:hypothetical protein